MRTTQVIPAEQLSAAQTSSVPSMMDMLRVVTPLNRAVCSLGYDQAASWLQSVLPFRIITIPQSHQHNGWVIPPSWEVEQATISRDGRIIYDGCAHPLGVIALSSAFTGSVSLAELRRHLHFDHRDDRSIPFHYRQQFRSWARDWGFCVPRRFFDSLVPGDYDVCIRTRETPGELKILQYQHTGSSGWTIAICGNLDHPGVANDGPAGCVVGIEALRRLRGRKTKFTYSLILSPGIIGSELYLATMPETERSRILEGVFLEMLGARAPLALQASRRSMVSLHHAMLSALRKSASNYRTGPFESIIVNDEYIWENYGISMLSLSRFPYPEYHSSHDSLDAVTQESLDEAVNVLVQAIDELEATPLIVRKFSGNICLSNPAYDLYLDYGQVALGQVSSAQHRRMRVLMDLIPALDRPVTVRAVAAHVDLPEDDVLAYLQRWAEKGLIEIF